MLRKEKVPAERARELSHGINFDCYQSLFCFRWWLRLWGDRRRDSGRDIVRPLATLSQGAERPTTPRVVEMNEVGGMAVACPASLRILENVQSMARAEPESC